MTLEELTIKKEIAQKQYNFLLKELDEIDAEIKIEENKYRKELTKILYDNRENIKKELEKTCVKMLGYSYSENNAGSEFSVLVVHNGNKTYVCPARECVKKTEKDSGAPTLILNTIHKVIEKYL